MKLLKLKEKKKSLVSDYVSGRTRELNLGQVNRQISLAKRQGKMKKVFERIEKIRAL